MFYNSKRQNSKYRNKRSKNSSSKNVQMQSHRNINNVFKNSNNVYNNFIIQNGDRVDGPFSFLNIQKNSNKNSTKVMGAGVSLVGQSKIKKQVYHVGKNF